MFRFIHSSDLHRHRYDQRDEHHTCRTCKHFPLRFMDILWCVAISIGKVNVIDGGVSFVFLPRQAQRPFGSFERC